MSAAVFAPWRVSSLSRGSRSPRVGRWWWGTGWTGRRDGCHEVQETESKGRQGRGRTSCARGTCRSGDTPNTVPEVLRLGARVGGRLCVPTLREGHGEYTVLETKKPVGVGGGRLGMPTCRDGYGPDTVREVCLEVGRRRGRQRERRSAETGAGGGGVVTRDVVLRDDDALNTGDQGAVPPER